MRRFLNTLQKGEEPDTYLVADRIWRGYGVAGLWDQLSLNEGEARLAVYSHHDRDEISWEYSLQLADGPAGTVNFSLHGKAETVDAACVAILECKPEIAMIEYLGRTVSCYGAPGFSGATKWTFATDGELAEVVGPFTSTRGEAPYYNWRRSWQPAKALLGTYCGPSSELQGKAATMKDAVIAAIDAPELFKRAAGKLIATLAGGQP